MMWMSSSPSKSVSSAAMSASVGSESSETGMGIAASPPVTRVTRSGVFSAATGVVGV